MKAEEHSVTTRATLDGFTETYEQNRVKDIYAFADQIERADYQSNLAKASSVLITGELIFETLIVLYKVSRDHYSLSTLTGLKIANFPKDISSQNSRGSEIVKDLIRRVLGREEQFTLLVRRSGQQRFAKDSAQVVVPPLEVDRNLKLKSCTPK